MAGALDGIRVLDFTRVLSGPSCTKALADLGADVIKVEPPAGDMTRTSVPVVDGIPVYFAQQNAGKRFISLDLATEEGRGIARRLADECDVLVENFRPGVMARLGLDAPTLHKTNPKLIYCAITGYGQTGSDAQRRAYAPMIHAEIGMLNLTAERRSLASGSEVEPTNEIVSWADLQSGVQAALGIAAALFHRERTGEGQVIDVAMADVVLQMTEWTAVEVAGGEGEGLAVFGPAKSPVVTTADGTRASCPGDPVVLWPRWLEVIGSQELRDDPRFASRRLRADNRIALMATLRTWAQTVPNFDELEGRLEAVGFACGRLNNLADVRNADWAEHRGSLTDVGDRAPVLIPTSAFRFSDLEAGPRTGIGDQGRDNETVLRELLHLSEDELSSLRAAGAVVTRPRDRA